MRPSRTGIVIVALLALVVGGVLLNSWVDGMVREASRPRATATLAPGQTPPATPAPTLAPADLAAAFDRPADRATSAGPVRLRVQRIDDLVVPSGAIVAADPFFVDSEAFTVPLAAGRYRVDLLVASFATSGDAVAAARVGEPGSAPVTWEEARTASNAGLTASPGFFFGYGVDSGTGSFFSAEAAAAATKDAGYADRMLAALQHAGSSGVEWADVVSDPVTGANVVAFSSGFGDGAYVTYVARDAHGTAVAFMTDFAVVDNP